VLAGRPMPDCRGARCNIGPWVDPGGWESERAWRSGLRSADGTTVPWDPINRALLISGPPQRPSGAGHRGWRLKITSSE